MKNSNTKKKDKINEGKPSVGKNPSPTSTIKHNPKSDKQSHPTLTPKVTKNAMNKFQPKFDAKSLFQHDIQRCNALHALSQLTLDEVTNLVNIHCSSKKHPKEPSTTNAQLLKHPAPLPTELILDPDIELNDEPCALFLKCPVPPSSSPCTIDIDDDSVSTLSRSEEDLNDEGTEDNSTPSNDSSGTGLCVSVSKKKASKHKENEMTHEKLKAQFKNKKRTTFTKRL